MAAAVCGAGQLNGRVVGVADGDTLTVLVDGAPVVVRLAEIDAPEKGQPFGARAKQSLSQLCAGLLANVRERGRDRYGRALGRVSCAGVDANLAQVSRGMAWVYAKYSKDAELLKAQQGAQQARSGLWADARPTPPWEWRASSRGEAP